MSLLAQAGLDDQEAVVCMGSYLGDGFDEDSDIDVLLVSDRHRLRKRLLEVDGRLLDLTECSHATLEELLRRQLSRRDWLEILALAQVVEDRQGRTTRLCREARGAFAIPDAVDLLEIRMAKATLAKHLRKLRRQSAPGFLFFEDSLGVLDQLYMLYCYREHLRPYEYSRLRAAHIEAAFPDLAALARRDTVHRDGTAAQIAQFCDTAQGLLDGLFPQVAVHGVVKQLDAAGATR
jgi:hypothetical protein